MTKEGLKYLVGPVGSGTSDLSVANPVPLRQTWVSEYYKVVKEYLIEDISMYHGNAIALNASLVKGRLDLFFDETVKVGVW